MNFPWCGRVTSGPSESIRCLAQSSIDESTLPGVSGVITRSYNAQVEHAFRRYLVATLKAGFTTPDCRKTYEELKAKGVEITQEPIEHFYGTDIGIRDPFGNHLRIVQPAEGPIEVPPPDQLGEGFQPRVPGETSPAT